MYMAKPKKGTQKELFSVYGEFDSYMEINKAAAGLLKEGDLEGLRTLAGENGLEEDVELYISGNMEALCDPVSAALGKLKVEKEYTKDYITTCVIEYLESCCDDVEMVLAIRKKGKKASDMYKIIENEARRNRKGNTGTCSDMRAFQLTREYYRGGGAE